jgi:hypothetical protein
MAISAHGRSASAPKMLLTDRSHSTYHALQTSLQGNIGHGGPGVQQTGAGANGVDRPDQIATPILSTSRKIREDYFGLGENNASFFSIPAGSFGTLGRDTFRGPAFHNFDFALIKNTTLATRARGGELAVLQFRAEFFNLFNIVNFGLPANIVKGTGFGEISRTAGTSRQIQFSMKLIF